MLMIETYVGPSKIHGVGCFAAQDVPVGALIWSFNARFALEVRYDDLACASVPSAFRRLIDVYAWNFDGETDSVFLDLDNARFMNHSLTPNTAWIDLPNRISYGFAAQDLAPGDEITTNYKEEDTWWAQRTDIPASEL
jgi:SET domain-containing protein